jgi:hypothetical protein
MKIVSKIMLLCLFLGGLGESGFLWGQALPQSGQRVGLYISSRSFGYAPDFFIEVAQFLKLEEDRSNIGKMKNELIIRLGDELARQLQALSDADTVYFLNANLELGRAMLAAYDTAKGYLLDPDPVLQELDQVLVIDPFFIASRNHRSVFIRSNRMISQNIPVKKARFTVILIEPQRPRIPYPTEVCYDDLKSAKPTLTFDFMSQESQMGLYLSQVFSQWWGQWSGELSGSCAE